MDNEKVYQMKFAAVYPLLVQKAQRQGRTSDAQHQGTRWLTGYSPDDLEELSQGDLSYGEFFRQAPKLNPARKQIKGIICGFRVEEIKEPLMQEIRYLDKLVDELARGKAMEKILRKPEGAKK